MRKLLLVCAALSACTCDQNVRPAEGALSVQPSSLDFGSRGPGSISQLPLTLRNDGAAELTVTPSLEGEAFRAALTALTLQAGSSAELSVEFRAPAVEGAVVGRLTLTTTSRTTPQVLVPLVGTVLTAPGDAGSDAGSSDAGTLDAGTADAGTTDAGTTDAGAVDAGAVDAGAPDAGTPDAGSPDAGGADAGRACPGQLPGALGCEPVTALWVGWGSVWATSASGALWSWGENPSGELGQLGPNQHRPQVVVGLDAGVRSVATGLGHTCVVLAGGQVRCWGWNSTGQLGSGDAGAVSPGVLVALPAQALEVSAQGQHTCALLAGSAAHCWGSNFYGQVGGGATSVTGAPTPSYVARTISAGVSHTCAAETGGAASCWGYNYAGQLGNNSAVDSPTPVFVQGLSPDTQVIAAGMEHSCAYVGSSGVWCWGRNAEGQLGNNSTVGSRVPVQVSGLATAVALGAGGLHSCALSSGAVWCWGANFSGQLGDGTTTNRLVPVPVALDASVVDVAVGYAHSCALTDGGLLYCWGRGSEGQLGRGSDAGSLVPVLIEP